MAVAAEVQANISPIPHREQLIRVEIPVQGDILKEKCAVTGVFIPAKKHKDSVEQIYPAVLTENGLLHLQHRGQDASGVVSYDGKTFHKHKAPGLVTNVFDLRSMYELEGQVAVGHNRYATDGGPDKLQPILGEYTVLAHNGTLPIVDKLKDFLQDKIDTTGMNDSQLMHAAIEWNVKQGMLLEEAVEAAVPLFTGAYALVIAGTDRTGRQKLIGLRDDHGIRPLSMGKLGKKGFALASETYALDKMGAKKIVSVKPGQMVVITNEGMRKKQIIKKVEEKLDVFELVYFSHPESKYFGRKVADMRYALGRALAGEYPHIEADLVIGVPRTGKDAAKGYADARNIAYSETALQKVEGTQRTFIVDTQEERERLVKEKFDINPEEIRGKRIVLVDDSLVRGTTWRILAQELRAAGATEVTFLSSCPEVLFPDFYGINTPTQEELLAPWNTNTQMEQIIGARLGFLSLNGMIRALGVSRENLCLSCFTGEYPIEIGVNNRANINFLVFPRNARREVIAV